MADPKQVLEFARRVFPNRDAAAEQAHRTASVIEARQVAVAAPAAMPREAAGARAIVGVHSEADLATAVRAGADTLPRLDELTPDNLDPQEKIGLEAIVLLVGRPAVLIQDDDFGAVGDMWQPKLDPHHAEIREAIRRVGRTMRPTA